MSQADVMKQLKVKTNSAKRLHKEMAYYEKEKESEQARVEKLRAEGAEASDLKQAEMVLQESMMMIPQTKSRLEGALGDLESFVAANEQDVAGTEELEAAKETIAAVKATLGA